MTAPALTAPRSFVWRGIALALKEWSAHSGHVRFESEAALWKVECFHPNDIGYARLRLGSVRLSGKGSSKLDALDAARTEAERVLLELEAALGRLE